MEDEPQGGVHFAANGNQLSLAVNFEGSPGVARRLAGAAMPQKSPRKRKNYVPVKVVKIPRQEEEDFNGYHWDEEDEYEDEKKANLEGESAVNIVGKWLNGASLLCVHVCGMSTRKQRFEFCVPNMSNLCIVTGEWGCLLLGSYSSCFFSLPLQGP